MGGIALIIVGAAIVLVIAVLIFNKRKFGNIQKNGVKVDAVVTRIERREFVGAADGEDPHVLDAKEIRLHVPDGRGVEEVLAPETIDNL